MEYQRTEKEAAVTSYEGTQYSLHILKEMAVKPHQLRILRAISGTRAHCFFAKETKSTNSEFVTED